MQLGCIEKVWSCREMLGKRVIVKVKEGLCW